MYTLQRPGPVKKTERVQNWVKLGVESGQYRKRDVPSQQRENPRWLHRAYTDVEEDLEVWRGRGPESEKSWRQEAGWKGNHLARAFLLPYKWRQE